MLRLPTRSIKTLVLRGTYSGIRPERLFCKENLLPTRNGLLTKPNLLSMCSPQVASYANVSHDKKSPRQFSRRVRDRIKYQSSNEILFKREKIQRNLSEVDEKASASSLNILEECDQFGTISSGQDEDSGRVRKNSEKQSRSSSENSQRKTLSVKQKKRSDQFQSGASDSNKRNSTKNVKTDTFGNFVEDSLPQRSKKTLQRTTAEKSSGIYQSVPQTHLDDEGSDDVRLSVESPESQDDDVADTFGAIAEDFEDNFLRPGPITTANVELRSDESLEVEDDFKLRLSKDNRKHHQNWYERRIEKLARNGNVLEALDFLEKTMVEKDRVMPTAFAFTVVIDAMAKYGYPQGAFRLFRKMLSHELTPYDQTYTALFNACANCPDKAQGLKFASRFRETLAKKDILPNRTTYKAMMKAYAMFGDLQTTFALADELYEKRGRIDHDSFSHMLMGAISDREAGFKHAVEVFRSICKHKQTPSITHYNLLLRAMRDCGVGNKEFLHQLLGGAEPTTIAGGQVTLEQSSQQYIESSEDDLSAIVKLDSSENLIRSNEVVEKDVASFLDIPSSQLSKIPDILSPNPDTKQMISVADINNSSDRLELVGGVPGLLAHMKRDGVTPDIKTFTLLLDVMPSNTHFEEMLVTTLALLKVIPDTGFFTMLMRKRVFRQDYEAARSVLDHLIRHNLTPDIKTFGVLALTCRKKKEAFVLLTDLQNLGLEPTSDIMSHLGRASDMDFEYKLSLVSYMRKHDMKPTEKFLQFTEKKIRTAKRIIVDKERGEKVPYYARYDRFNEEFGNFLKNYKSWLLSIDVQTPEPYWKMFKDHNQSREQEKKMAAERKKSVFLRKDEDFDREDLP